MRKNFGAKPLTYPQPVFIIATYGEDGTPDAMNAAWGGISEMNEISLCLSAGHKTVKNILARKAFTVSMAEAGQVVACDYVGLVSGNRVSDKFARAGFHATKSAFVDAPLIDELSVAVECKLKDYNPETRERGRARPRRGRQRGRGESGPHHVRPLQQRLLENRRKGGTRFLGRKATEITQPRKGSGGKLRFPSLLTPWRPAAPASPAAKRPATPRT